MEVRKTMYIENSFVAGLIQPGFYISVRNHVNARKCSLPDLVFLSGFDSPDTNFFNGSQEH